MSTTKKKDELEQQKNQTVPAQSSTVQQTQSTQTSGRNYQSPWQTQINDTLNQYLNQYKAADEVSKDITKRLINLEEQLTHDIRSYL